MSEQISVLLVDDHVVVRRGFRRLLEDDSAIMVVGEASNGSDAIALADSLRPSVVVMDCSMPGTGGLAAARAILERQPAVAILMLSMHNDSGLARQAFDAGARGYLVKDALDVDLAQAVKEVARGETVVDPRLAGELAQPPGTAAQSLSRRQLQVLQLICDGLSSHEIAGTLGISVNTVGVHRTHIMKALGVRRVSALVTHAVQHRLVKPPATP